MYHIHEHQNGEERDFVPITHLGARDAIEANRHEHSSDRDLVVTKLDTIQVLHTETVRRDETVERQDLVHLDRCDERAPTLADDVRDCTRQVSSTE